MILVDDFDLPVLFQFQALLLSALAIGLSIVAMRRTGKAGADAKAARSSEARPLLSWEGGAVPEGSLDRYYANLRNRALHEARNLFIRCEPPAHFTHPQFPWQVLPAGDLRGVTFITDRNGPLYDSFTIIATYENKFGESLESRWLCSPPYNRFDELPASKPAPLRARLGAAWRALRPK